MILTILKIIKGSPLLQCVIAAAIALGSFKTWQFRERSIGAKAATEKIEKANDKAIGIGNAGAGKSGVPGVRGKRDPHTRDNETD